MINRTRTETRPRPLRGTAVGNIGQMSESLIQQCRVGDEGLLVVKPFQQGVRYESTCFKKVPANFVPAAAVIRRGRALFGIIGRKGCVGGLIS